MSEQHVFNPRDLRYKSPFGAVACNTEVSFTLRPLVQEQFTRCTLLIWQEFAFTGQEIDLPAQGEGLFCGTFTAPAAPELVWYGFRFARTDGSVVWLGKNGYCSTKQEMISWQLTVYDGKSTTPDWFGNGVTYQIFPDRFHRLSVPDATGMVGDRVVHQGWDEPMVYKPDEKGEILNNDYYGGSLQGIRAKLDYLQSLHVTTLYLCPIFEAASNHRYNTADYLRIDPMLGTEEDFRQLCAEAKTRGIRIMLDGVFNHTGNNSRYFNADGFYPELGAAQSKDSPYYNWFNFSQWPKKYDSWWGIHTLPAVNENHPDYREFIITGEDSVVRHWLRAGASAWRLDVADELPDDFIADIRRVMEEEQPDSFLLGEVWEDGSNKISYSSRRRYLLGSETHGLMNYPFRTAALAWLTGGDASAFRDTMETIRENYPPAAFYSGLNILGTHDTPRILTLIGVDNAEALSTKDMRAAYRLSDAERKRGMQRLHLAAMLSYSFPGSPTLFYGDEAGMQGFEDPLNRGTYPWGYEDAELVEFYRTLGKLRMERSSMQRGSIEYLHAQGGALVLRRTLGDETTVTALNNGDKPLVLTLPWSGCTASDALSGQVFAVKDGILHLSVAANSGMILV